MGRQNLCLDIVVAAHRGHPAGEQVPGTVNRQRRIALEAAGIGVHHFRPAAGAAVGVVDAHQGVAVVDRLHAGRPGRGEAAIGQGHDIGVAQAGSSGQGKLGADLGTRCGNDLSALLDHAAGVDHARPAQQDVAADQLNRRTVILVIRGVGAGEEAGPGGVAGRIEDARVNVFHGAGEEGVGRDKPAAVQRRDRDAALAAQAGCAVDQEF